MLQEWERRFPGRIETIFNSLTRIDASHLFDRRLFDFASVLPSGQATPEGDTAFDPVEPNGGLSVR
jgi:tRNA 2-thiocytidine biosynthesis protein TtcA